MRVSAATLAGWQRFPGWPEIATALIENSLDAGAGRVTVHLTPEGLEVEDTGNGLDDTTWQRSFLRGATRRVRTHTDLATLQTYGMRGESLYLLRRVARVARRGATEPGTVIVVRRYRQSTGEFPSALDAKNDMLHQMRRYALAQPGVAFRLTHDGATIYDTDATGPVRKGRKKAEAPVEAPPSSRPPLLTRLLAAIDGKAREEHFTPVAGEVADLTGELMGRIEGFLTWPNFTAEDDTGIFLSVNGLPMRLRGGALACIRESYAPAEMERQWPIGVLNLTVPTALIDRTGAEVRFARLPKGSRNPVYYGLGRAVWEALAPWRFELLYPSQPPQPPEHEPSPPQELLAA